MTTDTVRERGDIGAVLPWHARRPALVLEELAARSEGLTDAEADDRLEAVGLNRLPDPPKRGLLSRIAAQFRNLLVLVLIAAAVLAAAIGEVTDALVVLLVVVLNAAVGVIQEGRAEQALAGIRTMIDPIASVLRDGRRMQVPAERVAPGDVVLVEAGDRVPADLRLLRASALRIDEAILTGESVPARKAVAAVGENAPLGDRHSMAYSGTFVAAGQGAGVAVATGERTELGRISAMLGGVERLATPLTRRMDQFARQVTIVVLSGSVLVFGYAALVAGYPLGTAVMIVVGLAVGAIPEGLPAVTTVTLAVGVRRMARRNAIIRRLPAVETLGSVSVICSDKTGTLTRNEMTARTVLTATGPIEVEGEGYGPEGRFAAAGKPVDPLADPLLMSAAEIALLCNDAEIRHGEGGWTVAGDPMEGALLALATRAGLDRGEVRRARPRLAEVPFDSLHGFMATLNDRPDGDGQDLMVKGAPERVIPRCGTVLGPEGETTLDGAAWLSAVDGLAAGGQRIIAVARRRMARDAGNLDPGDVGGLVLVACIGLIDPPRMEVAAAVRECVAAGIRVKMITGDHSGTARAIAVELGLADNPVVVTGTELDGLDAQRLREVADRATVFARTTPEHKLRLVEALQADGAVIAMTGDGVNDAPALKRADIGVAMGGKGTEAAKEASQMVLADDNFTSIVAAVREGRTVNDNLTKVIGWTLPTNGGEALLIILAVAFGAVLPVTPIQILWINTVTASTLGLALAFEPTEPGVMRRPPRSPGAGLLDARLVWRIVLVSLLMVAGSLGVFGLAMSRGLGLETARTMVVDTVVVMEMFYLFSIRYVHGASLTWRGVVGTPAVLIAVTVVVAAQLAFTYLPAMQGVFGTAPLGWWEGALVIAAGILLFVVVEIEKTVAARLTLRRG